MTIGERIQQRRKEIGMSVDELAKNIGKDRSTIYRYENGDIKKFPLDILEPIADVLGINIQELVYDDLPISTTDLYSKILTDNEFLKSIQEYYELSDDDKKMIRDLISRLKNN